MAFLKHGKFTYTGPTVIDFYSFDNEMGYSSVNDLIYKFRELDTESVGNESILLSKQPVPITAEALILTSAYTNLIAGKSLSGTLEIRGESATVKLRDAKRVKKIVSSVTAAAGYITGVTSTYTIVNVTFTREV